jgi:hypothetical protein
VSKSEKEKSDGLIKVISPCVKSAVRVSWALEHESKFQQSGDFIENQLKLCLHVAVEINRKNFSRLMAGIKDRFVSAL